MTGTDDLAYSFDDARANQLRDGARLTTRDKIAFFEEMADFAFRFAPESQPIAPVPASRATRDA